MFKNYTYTNHRITDPTVSVPGPTIGRFSGIGVTIRNRTMEWKKDKGDLHLVVSQKSGITSLRFRGTVRGLLARGKASEPLSPTVKEGIRNFAKKLAGEFHLTANFCSSKCGTGHAWFIVTFT